MAWLWNINLDVRSSETESTMSLAYGLFYLRGPPAQPGRNQLSTRPKALGRMRILQ
ncbi:MAG TPA: hypothetical protein VGK64_04290 [Bryobacteraceae bacterium]